MKSSGNKSKQQMYNNRHSNKGHVHLELQRQNRLGTISRKSYVTTKLFSFDFLIKRLNPFSGENEKSHASIVFCLPSSAVLILMYLQAAVRGMDTIQDVALKMANVKVNRFLVSGASKVHILYLDKN